MRRRLRECPKKTKIFVLSHHSPSRKSVFSLSIGSNLNCVCCDSVQLLEYKRILSANYNLTLNSLFFKFWVKILLDKHTRNFAVKGQVVTLPIAKLNLIYKTKIANGTEISTSPLFQVASSSFSHSPETTFCLVKL